MNGAESKIKAKNLIQSTLKEAIKGNKKLPELPKKAIKEADGDAKTKADAAFGTLSDALLDLRNAQSKLIIDMGADFVNLFGTDLDAIKNQIEIASKAVENLAQKMHQQLLQEVAKVPGAAPLKYGYVFCDWKENLEDVSPQLAKALKQFGLFLTRDPQTEGSDGFGCYITDRRLKKSDLKALEAEITMPNDEIEESSAPLEEGKKEIAELQQELVKYKIDTVRIISFTYQYRYNGVDADAKFFSKGKEIEADLDMSLAEALRNKINKARNDNVQNSDIIAVLPGIKVLDAEGKPLDPESDIETDLGTDS